MHKCKHSPKRKCSLSFYALTHPTKIHGVILQEVCKTKKARPSPGFISKCNYFNHAKISQKAIRTLWQNGIWVILHSVIYFRNDFQILISIFISMNTSFPEYIRHNFWRKYNVLDNMDSKLLRTLPGFQSLNCLSSNPGSTTYNLCNFR